MDNSTQMAQSTPSLSLAPNPPPAAPGWFSSGSASRQRGEGAAILLGASLAYKYVLRPFVVAPLGRRIDAWRSK